MPLFVGEFDGFGQSINPAMLNPNWQTELELMMDYFKQEEINWAFWTYSGYYSLLIPGTYDPKPELLKTLQRGL